MNKIKLATYLSHNNINGILTITYAIILSSLIGFISIIVFFATQYNTLEIITLTLIGLSIISDMIGIILFRKAIINFAFSKEYKYNYNKFVRDKCFYDIDKIKDNSKFQRISKNDIKPIIKTDRIINQSKGSIYIKENHGGLKINR